YRDILSWCDELNIKYEEKTKHRIHLIDSNEKFRTYLLNEFEKFPNLEFKFETNVKQVSYENEIYSIKDKSGQIYKSKKLVFATGGLSYIRDEIFGSGYKLASSFNHTIANTYPIGVGLILKSEWLDIMQGVSASDVKVSVYDRNENLIVEEKGNLMFTHFGLGGPVIRRVSGLISKHLMNNQSVKINLSFMEENEILKELSRNKRFFHCFKDVSKKLLFELFDKEDMNHDIDLGNISKVQKSLIIKCLTNNEFIINNTQQIQLAINTGGGIKLNEITPNSFESKNYKGLYFIGEILDVNPKSNGFNLTSYYMMARCCADHINNN
ncbi:MAG: aminoacetone oxidase family FAD-binding enzyme, partial [Mycoplasma sp.]